MTGLRRALLAGAAAGAVLALSAAARPPPRGAAGAGRYVLHGDARVETTSFGTHETKADLDAVVAAGGRPGTVRLELQSGRYACALAARATAAGELTLEGGQRCPVDVAEEGARGHVDARLTSGRGHLGDDALRLDLTFDLSGDLSVGVRGKRITVLGADLEVPGAWTTPAPLRGTVTASARGGRLRPGSAAPAP